MWGLKVSAKTETETDTNILACVSVSPSSSPTICLNHQLELLTSSARDLFNKCERSFNWKRLEEAKKVKPQASAAARHDGRQTQHSELQTRIKTSTMPWRIGSRRPSMNSTSMQESIKGKSSNLR
ncbi:hypothetical protein Taro_010914 [Colocasia esculenta]|uniref:Uncharacterized protein n=1 Tax=Colocasia esculenta TaxID=4460 RepID=A0A843UEH9_COLES|nr:hypothetical protein [Colocasia esculenta]